MADFNTGRTLVTAARERGITFRVTTAGAVHWFGPARAVTPEMLYALEEAVLDVLAYLKWEEERVGPQTSLKDVLGDVVAG